MSVLIVVLVTGGAVVGAWVLDLGRSRPEKERLAREWEARYSVPCPVCGAAAGNPCDGVH